MTSDTTTDSIPIFCLKCGRYVLLSMLDWHNRKYHPEIFSVLETNYDIKTTANFVEPLKRKDTNG